MENKWTLHVRDLGKIESADITVAPFMMFVGDNNSGKSYLMAILYTLLGIHFGVNGGYDICRDTPEYQSCVEWLEPELVEEAHEVVITEDVSKQFEKLWNVILSRNLDRIAQQTFHAPIQIGSLSVTFPSPRNQKFIVSSAPERSDGPMRTMLEFWIGTKPARHETFILKGINEGEIHFAISGILHYLLRAELAFASVFDACFLPTSRTGFLLTYKTLIRASISDAYDWTDQPTVSSQLTRPCSDFLKSLASLDAWGSNRKYDDIIQYIEEKIVGGHISLSQDTPQEGIRYRPKSVAQDFPMHLTSGVVTEVAPLLLMLKHRPMQALFIEEPEMELHPALQAEMAKVLNRIQKRDTSLIVATHSDIILQQINNMIKLGRLPADRQQAFMERFGYQPEDCIDPEEIAIYQFQTDPKTGRSTVQPLPHNEYGFVVPTFNRAFENLLKETRELEMDEG